MSPDPILCNCDWGFRCETHQAINDVAQLQERVTELEKTVVRLKATVDIHETTFEGMQASMLKLEDKVKKLEEWMGVFIRASVPEPTGHVK